jgi:hypothetical protein
VNASIDPTRFEVRFPSLIDDGQTLVFPCDAQGHVDMDALSERGVADYLFARATVGHDYDRPRVLPAL